VRGALLAGAKVHGMSIHADGRIAIHFGEGRSARASSNSWDDVLA
jgi:hypothetical protein